MNSGKRPLERVTTARGSERRRATPENVRLDVSPDTQELIIAGGRANQIGHDGDRRVHRDLTSNEVRDDGQRGSDLDTGANLPESLELLDRDTRSNSLRATNELTLAGPGP